MVKHLSISGRPGFIRSLGQEDSLEKEMVTHTSTLAQKIPWTEEPGVHGVAKSQTQPSDFTFFPPNTGLITLGPNIAELHFSVGKDIKLIRTETTLDFSQKAKK